MFNATALVAALSGLVGFRPDPAGAIELPEPLLESTSGLFVQDASELLTLDVLRHICPRTESVGDWLTRLSDDALSRFVGSLVSAQSLSAKVLLPTTTLVKNSGRRTDVVNPQGRFVGIRLRIRNRPGVAFELPSLTLQLDGTLTEPLPLYVYADSQPEPLYAFASPVGNKPNYPFVVPLDELAGMTQNIVGSTYYVGYYEADLPPNVRAIYCQVGPCGCADDPYLLWSEYVAATGFTVDPGGLFEDRSLFYAGDVQTQAGNFGLNLSFLASCDVVGALSSADNLLRLQNLVQQALAIRLYEAIATSPNVTAIASRPDLHTDALALLYDRQAWLYGGKVPGTEVVYPSALKNVALDLSGLDGACGPPKYSPLSMGSLRRW